MKIKFLTLFFLFLNTLIFGQTAQVFDKSNSEIIDDDLESLAIDKNGNKWLGTKESGFTLYDGVNFVQFKKEGFNVIKGDYITPIFIDSKNRIWICFSNPIDGIAMLDDNIWNTYTEKELGEVSVISISEDPNGILYFGGTNGIVTYDGTRWSKLDLPKGKYIVQSIDINKKGSIAVGHNDGLLIKENGKWKVFTEENSELKTSSTSINAVKFNDKGDLYIGYEGVRDGGFSILSKNKWQHFNKTNSKVPDNTIQNIKIAKNGMVWMATNAGVIKLEGDKITPIFFREGMYSNVILDIAFENENIWFATNFGLIKYVP